MIRWGIALSVVTLAVFSCSAPERDFGMGSAGSAADAAGAPTASAGAANGGGQGGALDSDAAGGAVTPASGGTPDIPGAGGVSGNPNGVVPLGGAAGAAPGSGDGGSGGEPEPVDPCLGKVCKSPPANGCVNATTLKAYDPVGSCNSGECSYASVQVPCTCQGNACTTDPCATVTCSNPPAAVCKDTRTVTKYASAGACQGGSCSYAATDMACASNNHCGGAGVCAVCNADSACGATCSACVGSKLKCQSLGSTSQCVACLADGDCAAGKRCDLSNNTCVTLKVNGAVCADDLECTSKTCGGRCCPTGTSCSCPQPSVSNKLQNPGFDSGNASWNAVSEFSDLFAWGNATTTSSGCPYSGSMQLTTTAPQGASTSQFDQCVPLDVSQVKSYYFGAALRNGDGAGANLCSLGECYLQWMTGSDCAAPEGAAVVKVQSAAAAWTNSVVGPHARPAGAGSARIACLVRSGALGSSCVFGFDQISFSESPAKY